MNFVDYLFEVSGASGDLFVVGTKEKITHSELFQRVEDASRAIAQEFGSDKEFIIISDNNLFFIVSYLAIMRSGNVPLLIEAQISTEDLTEIIERSSPAAFFIHSRHSERGPTGSRVIDEAELADLRCQGEDLRAAREDTDLAAVVFTSGSTGAKKGVMVTHGNLRANTESIIEYLGLTRSDRMLVVLPFNYCYGASLLHTHLRVGGSVVLSNSIFLGAALNEINRYNCTGLAGVPSTFQILIAKTPFLQRDMPSLRYMTQAGGKLEPVYIKQITDAFPGKQFFVMYGATEATARMSYLPPCKLTHKIGSIGKGIPGVTLEVLDSEGRPIRPGDHGEIVAQGANIMKGYYKDEAGTAEVLRDGRYHTGDLATIDEDGYIYIVGRSKDIIKSAGFRVSPNEVENVVCMAEGVQGCVVVGMPDQLIGEAIVAVIRPITVMDRDEVRERVMAVCNRLLPSYKVPRQVVFMDDFPLNSSNKVDKTKVREMLTGEVGLT